MKTIGLIGGMSWESTVPYYRLINEAVKARLGGLHSAKIILYSVDFHDVERLQQADDWEAAGALLAGAARALEGAGLFLILRYSILALTPNASNAIFICLSVSSRLMLLDGLNHLMSFILWVYSSSCVSTFFGSF